MINLNILNSVHQRIFSCVKDFIRSPTSINEILLIRCPSGLGATYNTRDAAFSKDIYSVWLGPSYLQVDDEVAKYASIPVLTGLNKNTCKQHGAASYLRERYFSPQRILCHSCSSKTGCKYNAMLNAVKNSVNGWCSHYNHIKNKFIGNSINKSKKKYKAIVIDGYFLDSLIDKKEFDIKDLNKFSDFIIQDWLPTEYLDRNRKFLIFVSNLALCLGILIILRKNLRGAELVKELCDGVYRHYSSKDFEDFSEFNIKYFAEKFYELIEQPYKSSVKNLYLFS
jgi:hypothetical protein